MANYCRAVIKSPRGTIPNNKSRKNLSLLTIYNLDSGWMADSVRNLAELPRNYSVMQSGTALYPLPPHSRKTFLVCPEIFIPAHTVHEIFQPTVSVKFFRLCYCTELSYCITWHHQKIKKIKTHSFFSNELLGLSCHSCAPVLRNKRAFHKTMRQWCLLCSWIFY